MTTREARLLRLTRLRERQHDVASLHLRAAQGEVAAVEIELDHALKRSRAALLCRVTAAFESDSEERLLACANFDGNELLATSLGANRAGAMSAMHAAAEAESTARRERKQMEIMLEAVQCESAMQAARADQRTLDEIVRLHAFEAARRAFSRRGF